ncbi:putative B3 domain-containing protein-like [Capsicum annuum]|nr:putative B3 domain-containing protein-like [Capsicum annuum]
MVHPYNEACEMCTHTRTGMLMHGQRDPSPIVSSFFKVMVDVLLFEVLHFPPSFAQLVSHLTDQETYLEDSSGQRWRVGICNHDGSLAIRQGWRTFSSEHGLKLGNFLVFHYIQCQHFVVQIFERSGCEKINFDTGTCTGKKRPRTNSTATSHDELSLEKWNSTPSVTAVPESERAGLQPVATTLASQFVTDGQGYPEAVIGNSQAVKSEPGDAGDRSFRNAVNFACSLQLDDRNFLELPPNWPHVLAGRKKMGRTIIYLKGPDNRPWPIIYHEKFGSKVLVGLWPLFTKAFGLKPGDECVLQLSDQAFGLKPGDECVLQLSDQSKRMFNVHAGALIDHFFIFLDCPSI